MHKAQAGFVQNFIIPGIILIGVIIAGVAMLSGGTSVDNSTDKTRMAVDVFLAQGGRFQAALSRAVAGGVIPVTLTGDVDLSTTLLASPIMSVAELPVPSEMIVSSGQSWQYSQRAYRLRNAEVVPVDIGSSLPDDIMYVRGVRKAACAFINARLYGVLTLGSGAYNPGGGLVSGTISGPSAIAPASQAKLAREGCVSDEGSATDYVYYKVIGEH